MNYICPVCAFKAMPYAPVPYNICPCCGTEFGVDDRLQSTQQTRQTWIKNGMPWFDDITSPPFNWSASIQLISAGYGADLIAPSGFPTPSAQKNIYLPTKLFWSQADLNRYTVVVGA
jgi:hypothetical protein